MDEHQRPLPAELIDHSGNSESNSHIPPLRPEIVEGEDSRHHSFEPYGAVVSVESSALVALGLAIASWFIIPFVGAIAALVMASKAKHKIRQADAGTLAGRSMATAAQVIAWANLLLFAFVAWLIYIAITAIF